MDLRPPTRWTTGHLSATLPFLRTEWYLWVTVSDLWVPPSPLRSIRLGATMRRLPNWFRRRVSSTFPFSLRATLVSPPRASRHFVTGPLNRLWLTSQLTVARKSLCVVFRALKMTLNCVLPRYDSGLCRFMMLGSIVLVGSCMLLRINLSAIEVCRDTPRRTLPVLNLVALAGIMNLWTLLLACV